MKLLSLRIYLLTLFFLSYFLATFQVKAQTVLFSEYFDSLAIQGVGCDGAAICTAPASGKWTTSKNGASLSSGDWVKVVTNQMEWLDTDGEGVWASKSVDVSGYMNLSSTVKISLTYGGSSDYLRVYYILDGGAEIAFPTNGLQTGSTMADNTSKIASVSGLSGTTFQIVVRAANSSSSERWKIDDIEIEGTPPSCLAPTPVATSPVFSGVSTTAMNVAWSNGGGTATLVVAKVAGVGLSEPVNTVAYSANSNYALGSDLGGGNYVVYNSTGSSVAISGLSPGTTYDFAIYTFNAADNCYNLTELSASQATICTPPVTQASSLSFSNIAKTSMDISWANGSGDAVLVVAKNASSTHADPAIGINYTANSSFGSGDDLGYGNYVIYNGTASSVSLLGLSSNTDYDISIYTYFSASKCYNLIELSGVQTTLAGINYSGLGDINFEIDVYNGDTITGCTGWFTDSNPSTTGNYGNNEDYTITFCSGSGDPMSFDFDVISTAHFDALATGDTLYMYDENGNLLMKIDGTDDPSFTEFHLSSVSQCVTFRFVSDGASNDDGWRARIACIAPPADCNGNQAASDIALDAPYLCNFDGYCGSTSSYYHEDLPGNMIGTGSSCPSSQAFVGTIQNNSWLRFVAGATTVSMDFTVSGCGSDGIQVAILGVSGNDWTRYSDCSLSDGGNNGSFTLTGTGLTVGETYFVMADGNAGANCDYVIDVDDSDGLITLDAGADQTVCSGDPVNLSVNALPGVTYTWHSLDGVVSNVQGENQTFNPIVATTYVVEISGGDICKSQTDTVEVLMCTVLPVELLGFSAECEENFVRLNWQTASEINNDYFEVEKSIDGFNFYAVGIAGGAGNSNVPIDYVLQDFEATDAVVYYRLKQVDFDGLETYSAIIPLSRCDGKQYEIENLYYNDLSELVINYTTNKSQDVVLSLFDVQGRLMDRIDERIYQHRSQIKWSVSSKLDNGVYLVRLVSGNSVDVKRLVKSN